MRYKVIDSRQNGKVTWYQGTRQSHVPSLSRLLYDRYDIIHIPCMTLCVHVWHLSQSDHFPRLVTSLTMRQFEIVRIF